MGLSIVARAY
jgi:hypothetical protein